MRDILGRSGGGSCVLPRRQIAERERSETHGRPGQKLAATGDCFKTAAMCGKSGHGTGSEHQRNQANRLSIKSSVATRIQNRWATKKEGETLVPASRSFYFVLFVSFVAKTLSDLSVDVDELMEVEDRQAQLRKCGSLRAGAMFANSAGAAVSGAAPAELCCSVVKSAIASCVSSGFESAGREPGARPDRCTTRVLSRIAHQAGGQCLRLAEGRLVIQHP